MNLKEAFQYQNYLTRMLDYVICNGLYSSVVVKVEEKHLRSAAKPECQDEIVDKTAERKFDSNISVDTLIDFAAAIVEERLKVAKAIEHTKEWMAFALDAELNANKERRKLIGCLKDLSKIKQARVETVPGMGHTFNAEGNQVSFVYQTERTTTIDFDRNKVRAMLKSMSAEADRVSMEAEQTMLDSNVDLDPMFNMTDEIDDALAVFVENHSVDESTAA